MSGIASNYLNSTAHNAFSSELGSQSLPGMSNVKYSTEATLLSMTPAGGTKYLQTWQIVSQSSITGFNNAQVQVTETIQRMVGTSLYNNAIYATGNTCGSIILSGGATTNSFDSSAGTYAATAQNSNGNVATNGNVNLSGGSTHVHGNLTSPNSGSGNCSGGGETGLSASGGRRATRAFNTTRPTLACH